LGYIVRISNKIMPGQLHVRFDGPLARGLAHRLLPLMVVAGMPFLAGGCGKKEAAQTIPPPPETARQTAALPAPAPQPSAAPRLAPAAVNLVQPDGQVDTGELQRCVIRWIVANHRRPASFEEFAATAGVAIPPPPAGKKYRLNKQMHVELVNR
jgi:hypothetical protein